MFREANELSRKNLANPHQHQPFIKRLKSNNSVDLRENMVTLDLGNGYSDIKPKDKNKRFK